MHFLPQIYEDDELKGKLLAHLLPGSSADLASMTLLPLPLPLHKATQQNARCLRVHAFLVLVFLCFVYQVMIESMLYDTGSPSAVGRQDETRDEAVASGYAMVINAVVMALAILGKLGSAVTVHVFMLTEGYRLGWVIEGCGWRLVGRVWVSLISLLSTIVKGRIVVACEVRTFPDFSSRPSPRRSPALPPTPLSPSPIGLRILLCCACQCASSFCKVRGGRRSEYPGAASTAAVATKGKNKTKAIAKTTTARGITYVELPGGTTPVVHAGVPVELSIQVDNQV